jgi:hypothetical protein
MVAVASLGAVGCAGSPRDSLVEFPQIEDGFVATGLQWGMTPEEVHRALDFATYRDPADIGAGDDEWMGLRDIIAFDHIWEMWAIFDSRSLVQVDLNLREGSELDRLEVDGMQGYDERFFQASESETITAARKAVFEAYGPANKTSDHETLFIISYWTTKDAVAKLYADYDLDYPNYSSLSFNPPGQDE